MHKPQKKLKKNQKKAPKHQGIVEKLVDRILRDEDKPQPEKADDLLYLIIKKCFVLPSARKGLLGDTNNLAVSGDGMVFETGASPYGIKECNCREKSIFNCNCPRRFSDPDVTDKNMSSAIVTIPYLNLAEKAPLYLASEYSMGVPPSRYAKLSKY